MKLQIASDPLSVRLQQARLEHAYQIADLIDVEARNSQMLPRPITDIYRQILNFVVVTQGEQVVACGSLEIFTETLAEVRSLVTHADHRGLGHASSVVSRLKEMATTLGLRELMALTYVPAFFEQLGFNQTSKRSLPEKVWLDCVRCPFYNNCKEIAMSMTLRS